MIIRIRFGGRPRAGGGRKGARRAALVASTLLTPAAVMAIALGCWAIAAEMGWTAGFAISEGVFSHWQVWFAAAILLEIFARVLYRFGRKNAAESR